LACAAARSTSSLERSFEDSRAVSARCASRRLAGGSPDQWKFEYDELKRLAAEHNIPLRALENRFAGGIRKPDTPMNRESSFRSSNLPPGQTDLDGAWRNSGLPLATWLRAPRQPRELRVGYPEIVYCAGKTPQQLGASGTHVAAFRRGARHRRSPPTSKRPGSFPGSPLRQCLPHIMRPALSSASSVAGYIAVVAAGTSDYRWPRRP